MKEKEIAELRRRFRTDKSNITHVRGCYVNEKKEIISQFDQSLMTMGPEESEKLLGILRKTLSGILGKNLLDITFDTRQVVEGEEHKLLMALRDSELQDQAAVEALFRKAIQSLDLEGNYLILLAYDAYDVPYRSKDGDTQADASSDLFRYVLCSICPVKLTKDALSYFVYENQFRNLEADWVVAAPETGFLFPAFDDRSTNLYNALYYTRREPSRLRRRHLPRPSANARRHPEGDLRNHSGGHPGGGFQLSGRANSPQPSAGDDRGAQRKP